MNSLSKQVGARLRAARKAAGFKSAYAFTQRYRLPSSTYSQHETGQRTLTLNNLLKYGELLEVMPNWLLTGEGAPYKVPNAEKELFLTLQLTNLLNDKKLEKLTYQTITNGICTVDMRLFKDILIEILTILTKNPDITFSNGNILDFCFDIYNTVITTTVDDNSRKSIITLAAKSILKGYTASNNLVQTL